MGQAVTKQDTHTGNVVSFTNNGGAEIDSLSVPIQPTQNLNGYSKPWAPGTGKNLLPDGTLSGDITITRNADGSYTMTGSTSASARIAVANFWDWSLVVSNQNDQKKHLPNGTYYANSGNPNIWLQVARKNGSGTSGISYALGASSGTFTIDDTYEYNWVRLNIPANVDPNVTLKPIICLNSEPDKSFEPYSNVCPISGSTGLSVYRNGRNFLAYPYLHTTKTENGVTFTDNGDGSLTIVTNGASTGIGSFTLFSGMAVPNGNYIFRCLADATTTSIYCGIAQKTTQSYNNQYCNTDVPVTVDDGNFAIIRVRVPTGSNISTPITIYPMLRLATDTDNTWEPYTSTTYAEDWTSQAGMVYGGTVDIKSGTLTVDRVLVSKTWSDGSNATTYGDCTRKRFSYSDADDKAKKTDAICNVGTYIPNDTSTEWAKGSVFSIHNSSNLFYLSLPTATDGTQAIQLCMYLATPVTYTLTAQTIAALAGANNIWASNNATIKVVVTDILAGFNGWLIKCVTNGTPVEIPLKYIRAETYTVTPDQRMEWSAERDVTGVLHRETVPNTPPKIEFNTPLMTNSDIEALNTIIRNAFTNVLGRDITIQYYNPEQNAYWEWDCYMPDVHYPIRNVDVANNIINYEELRYAFIGY